MKTFIKERELKNLSFDIFTKENINLFRVKLPVLKNACKLYKLKVTGTKPILIDRLFDLFNRYKFAIKIQSIVKMHQAYIYQEHLHYQLL